MLVEFELIQRAQQGDASAFNQIVSTYRRRILGTISRLIGRPEDVEDVAQQVFVKAYFSLKRFDLRSAFSTWLYKIAVNECWDYLRKKKVRKLVYEADMSDEQNRQLLSVNEQPFGALRSPEDAARRVEQQQLVELNQPIMLLLPLSSL